jgi:hypothetical protein
VGFTFSDHGSIWLCIPNNAAALDHLREHTSDEAQWVGENLVVEPRYVAGLVMALQDSGFTL